MQYFHLTDDALVIEMPALKRPTISDIKKDWIHASSIESDVSTEDRVTMRLSTILKPTEQRIDGATYELRREELLRMKGLLLGWQHRRWMLENQDKIESPGARAAIKALLGKISVDYSGIIVVSEVGDRNIPCIESDGKRWYGYWGWLGCDFEEKGRLAISLEAVPNDQTFAG